MDDAKSFPLDGKEAPAKEACVSCRRSKVKCAPSSEEGKKCERCARLGLECQGAGPSKRGRPGIFGSERFKASRERAAAAGEPEHLQVGAADAVQRPAGAGAPIVATLQRFAGSLPMGSVPDHSYSQSGNASLLASPSAAGTPGRGTPGVATPVISLGATPEQGSVGKLLAAAAARTDAVLVFPSTPSASASPNLDTRFLSTGPVSGHSEPRDGQSSAGNVSPAAAALPLTDWLTGCGVMRSELGCTAADVPDFGFSLPVRMLEGKPLKAARGQRSSQESGSQLLQSASAGMMPRGASAWPVFVSPPGMYVEPEDGFEPMLDFIVKTMPSRLAQRALVQTWASVAREENSYAKLSGALKTAEAVGLPAAGVLADTAPLGLLGGPQAAAHPGSLPPFVAEWFQGSCPCMVRYALGGKVRFFWGLLLLLPLLLLLVRLLLEIIISAITVTIHLICYQYFLLFDRCCCCC
ncbi:hypothetical protein T492DRAFT_190465 [Pavlovales sp. CCMP2436]|nr:hypothetical protein T492DRAFT_190465 [Pavlovales sp. CCMP2436]